MIFLCSRLGLRWPGALLLILALLSLLSNQVLAVIVNRTIDDTLGDSETQRLPLFLPATAGVWKDQTCTDCAIRPDTRRAFKTTYTSATYNPGLGSVNVTMDFNGTAIYIFLIIANNAGDGITSITNCVFKLDGQQVGTFEHSPDLTTTDVEYNVLAFSKNDIPFGQHRFVVATENINFNAYINFDYAIYTHDDDPVSTSAAPTPTPGAINRTSSSPTTSQSPRSRTATPRATSKSHSGAGAVVGGVIGGLACLGIIGIGIWIYVYRPRSRLNKNAVFLSDDDLPGSTGREILPTTVPNRGPPPLASSGAILIAQTGVSTGPSATLSHPSTTLSSELPIVTTVVSNSTRILDPATSRQNLALHVTNPDPQAQERVRSFRQAELRTQLMVMREEIDDLKADLDSRSLPSLAGEPSKSHETRTSEPSEPNPEKKNRQTGTVAELKEQIRVLMEQVANLQSQQSSPWAMGLTNESPPGYTPTMANSSVQPFNPDRKADS